MPRKDNVRVSVIIPTHNAAGTTHETLESLLAQTSNRWEAIIVDDGSSDDTAAVAAAFVAKPDARIRYVRQEQNGVSAARNAGVERARFDWLLFLDADDWVLPSYLERMVKVLESGIGVDAIFCGAAGVTLDGLHVKEDYDYEPGDMFHNFARRRVFPIHACIVRKSAVQSVGGFDNSLRTCEDWDLWQRIARTGARFVDVSEEVLALYRMRPMSASMDALQMLQDGLRVITLGHSIDPRVSHPKPEHEHGAPNTHFASTLLSLACWCAGLSLGRGEDAQYLLGLLNDERSLQIDPDAVAGSLFRAALTSAGLTPDNWRNLWPRIEGRVEEFLLALEAQTRTPGLARRTRIALEEGIPRTVASRLPTTHTIVVDITDPTADVFAPVPAERLQCLVKAEEKLVGRLVLPICDRFVPGYVVADAISAEFAWQILGLFFERTLYSTLTVKREEAGLSLWRGGLRLTEALPVDEGALREQAHDRVGWVIFLQEIWGQAGWPASRFYHSKVISAISESAPRASVRGEWATIEVSDVVPRLKVAGKEIQTVLTVGGVAIGAVTIPVTRGRVSATALRVALTVASGFELCRAAVREALLGRPLAEPLSLRTRLASARIARLARNRSGLGSTKDLSFAPGSAPAFDMAKFASERSLVLGRRAYEPMGTSASRRAMLPSAAFEDLLDSIEHSREFVIETYVQGNRPGRVVYAPELIHHSALKGQERKAPVSDTDVLAEKYHEAPLHGRSYFEALFATRADPWRYTNSYEQEKYEQTLSLIPEEEISRAIELGCAEGHFTAQLATKVSSLTASDISQVALDRVARRLKGCENVSFMRLDFMKEAIPGRFDLIVCSEVLYYTVDRKQLRALARKLTNALVPGGYLVTAHANQVVDEPDKPGFDWGVPFGAKAISDTLSAAHRLRLLKEIRTPLYRIQLFRREESSLLSFLPKRSEIIEAQHHDPLPPEIASQVRWSGEHGTGSSTAQKAVTARLPILMYHSVSTNGPSGLARYRVTPAMFEEQLQYLRDTGFRSVTLEKWRLAMEAKRPLPGRAVIITFDDGYRDFLTEAWPLLAKYDYSASIFLVARNVGRTNDWDQQHGQQKPLLGWEEIRELQRRGIEFGSHSLSHRPLTELPIEEAVREAVRSKTTLERGLGTRVRTFAYPYGASDGVIHHLIGACGYTFGLTCRSGPSQFHDSHLALPRIEIQGHDGLQEFAAKVGMVG
jgi:peptidoglycan/xylan/chitin deacetylase (PgdA/CDA1 family)/2-polyprenyl-3-methyl-5-hydroxy-6-metoxy-1,4-benzoquinol methylase